MYIPLMGPRRNRQVLLLTALTICLFFPGLPIGPAPLADEFLQLVTTIPIERDSTKITSVTAIGDFNADGYGDLAIGVQGTEYETSFEAVYLFYGGPGFDSLPDLRFTGNPQNQNICNAPGQSKTSYGRVVCPLGDFNGDGSDDFAVSATGLCHDYIYDGRIYLYFGGPDPDTIADLIIDGLHDWDLLGSSMAKGNFNGDHFGDLIICAGDIWYGFHVDMFLGNDPPDNVTDWFYDYAGQHVTINKVFGGIDPNGDGFSDFGWDGTSAQDAACLLFLGGDTLSHQPVLSSSDGFHFLWFDVSGDSIDDFFRTNSIGTYLCLGGSPLDFDPDYPAGRLGVNPFLYTLSGAGPKLLANDFLSRQLKMYYLGVPFDTIPYATVRYDWLRVWPRPDIGDINSDGHDDVALFPPLENGERYVAIYCIRSNSGVDDAVVPEDEAVLHCYPNPFNGSTIIQYDLPAATDVRLEIFDLLGRKIEKLDETRQSAGPHRVIWTPQDCSSGIYFCRIQAGSHSVARKLLLLK